jgi:DNA repair protein RadC
MLLAAKIPSAEKDADALISKFESITYLMQCDPFSLKEYTGCNDKTLHLIRLAAELTSRRITDQFKSGRKYSDEQYRLFAAGLMLAHTVENAYCILLDAAGRFISEEWLGEGVINSVAITPRKMLECAFRSNAKQIILIHNHPCGDAKPSDDDVRATATFKSAAESSGVKLLAHYVVSGFNVCDAVRSLSSSANPDNENEIMRVSIPTLVKE